MTMLPCPRARALGAPFGQVLDPRPDVERLADLVRRPGLSETEKSDRFQSLATARIFEVPPRIADGSSVSSELIVSPHFSIAAPQASLRRLTASCMPNFREPASRCVLIRGVLRHGDSSRLEGKHIRRSDLVGRLESRHFRDISAWIVQVQYLRHTMDVPRVDLWAIALTWCELLA